MKCLSSQPRMATSSARVNARQLSKVPQVSCAPNSDKALVSNNRILVFVH